MVFDQLSLEEKIKISNMNQLALSMWKDFRNPEAYSLRKYGCDLLKQMTQDHQTYTFNENMVSSGILLQTRKLIKSPYYIDVSYSRNAVGKPSLVVFDHSLIVEINIHGSVDAFLENYAGIPNQ